MTSQEERLPRRLTLVSAEPSPSQDPSGTPRGAEPDLYEFFEHVAIGLAEADSGTGRFLRANPELCRMLGYERAEVLAGMTFADLTHPDDLPLNFDEHRRLLAGEIQSYTIEKRYLRKDGAIIWGRVHAALTRHPDGRPKTVLAVIHDITERKRNEARLQLALEVGKVGTWDWDIEANAATCSSSYFPLYGLESNDHQWPAYEDWLSRIHPGDRARAAETLERAKATTNYAGEFRVVWPNGEIHWLAARGRLELTENGKPANMIGVNIDITSQISEAITADSAEDLPRYYVRQEFVTRSVILLQGDPANNFYLIITGNAKIYKVLPDGRTQLLGFRHPGDILGCHDQGEYIYCAEALGNVVVRRFSANQMKVLGLTSPSFYQRLLSNALRGLAESQEHAALLGATGARSRVAQFLLRLAANANGPDKITHWISAPISRQDIADYLGLRRETVSRILGELEAEGLIELKNRQVRIRNAGKLRQRVETSQQD